MRDNIAMAEEFVKTELGKDSSGHDWHHIDRVRKNARLYGAKNSRVIGSLLKWRPCSTTFQMIN